jgi:hypothetical protein
LHSQVIVMEKKYWIGRKRSAVAMARQASSAEARLIHYELAGRYSIKAAQCAPFMLPRNAPASEGERAALVLPTYLQPFGPRSPLAPRDPAQ